VMACGPTTRSGAIARLITAEANSGLGEWKAVLNDVKDLDLAAAPRLYARMEFLRMAAYASEKDEQGFAKARSRLLAAENQALARLSPVVERFEAGAFRVTAYKAAFNQGGFARKLEFIIEPTTPFAFPESIMLTDDINARSIMSQLDKANPAPNIFFVDLYTCSGHSTLPPPPFSKTGIPAYADVKPIVISALSQPAQPEVATALVGACRTSQWITPGLAH
jgi:hypothetical protein